jgi:hypothetical protein
MKIAANKTSHGSNFISRMSPSPEKITEDPELVLALPALTTVIAWRNFKQAHNLETAKITCCEKCKRLWKKLDKLEAIIGRGMN